MAIKIMDHEKKYNEALERARQFMSEHPTRAEADLMVALFPELHESEDERIREFLIDLLSHGTWKKDWPFSPAECVAWLEKQKEPKHDVTDAKSERVIKAARSVLNNWLDGTDCPNVSGAFVELEYAIRKYDGDEKQEERPIELCDGACCDDDRFKIIAEAKKDIVEKTNITENELSMELPLLNGILMRVWQVGWLNKKPAEWSEVDEAMRDNILRLLSCFVGTSECDSNPSLSTSYPAYQREMDWLKSLPLRCPKSTDNWKPSEEHLSALLAVFNDPNNIGSQTCQLALTDLYEQLKKL